MNNPTKKIQLRVRAQLRVGGRQCLENEFARDPKVCCNGLVGQRQNNCQQCIQEAKDYSGGNPDVFLDNALISGCLNGWDNWR